MDDLLIEGDCMQAMSLLPDASIDSCVTDPPYGLTQGKKGGSGAASVNLDTPYGRARVTTGNGAGGFMGQAWDAGVPPAEVWAEVLRVLKPGGWLLAFGGTRTCHRLVCAIEDAGFEIRDQMGWAYGQGFPKSHDVGKAVDKALGAKRRFDGARAMRWEGWGTALKPGWEPICVARKALDGTVAANVLRWGVGALNIDGCRVPTSDDLNGGAYAAVGGRSPLPGAAAGGAGGTGMLRPGSTVGAGFVQPAGRWPANLVHDGSPEVEAMFPDSKGQNGAVGPEHGERKASANTYGEYGPRPVAAPRGDDGSAARFFNALPFTEDDMPRLIYCPKARMAERGEANRHPTVKPVALMRHLVRLVTPPGGVVLDPFGGSGTTGVAALREGLTPLLIEREADYAETARDRMWTEMMT